MSPPVVVQWRVDAVRAAFDAVPRAGFLPRAARRRAGFDGPLSIGHGQTNSQPRTVAAMLVLLEVRAGDRVLDVGSGSAWTTALLAELTGSTGSVLGVELVPELVQWGRENLARTAYTWASVRQADKHVLGWPEGAPYDRILVSADARRCRTPWSSSSPRTAGSWCRSAGRCCSASGRDRAWRPAPTAATGSSRCGDGWGWLRGVGRRPGGPVSQVMKGNCLFTQVATCVKRQFGFLTWETGRARRRSRAAARTPAR